MYTHVPTATRRIQFCAGHRVMGHENKCAHMHGHNYVALVTARQESVQSITELNRQLEEKQLGLDKVGRVVDFSVLKDKIGGWIDRNWDHGFILHEHDKAASQALTVFEAHMIDVADSRQPDRSFRQKCFFLPSNPTAENMASFLLHVVGPAELKDTDVQLVKVVLWETENCYAEAVLA